MAPWRFSTLTVICILSKASSLMLPKMVMWSCGVLNSSWFGLLVLSLAEVVVLSFIVC